MGIGTEQYGSLLIPIIMTKLPQELRLHIAWETDRDVWQMDKLMAVINKEVEAWEATEAIKLHQLKHPVTGQSPHPTTPIAATFVTSGSSIRFVFCKKAYFSASCTKIQTLQERKAILIRSGRCFNCQKNNHKSWECEFPRTCRHCNHKHYQSICDKGNSRETQSGRVDGASHNGDSNTGTSSDNGSNTDMMSSTNITSVSKNHHMALLQTAHATALASLSGSSVPVRVSFDNGSQLSYIMERLQQQ